MEPGRAGGTGAPGEVTGVAGEAAGVVGEVAATVGRAGGVTVADPEAGGVRAGAAPRVTGGTAEMG
ncbi:hypothetical protein Ade02nite_11630 [Paractinoplanes deccanensis]|uniref:Uncharacterized protein n=1 Tax=Paractinoplanes deccanensis TaxID=113561 RepID=A0ABQ3XXP6_9ACTN|nr:hypothetical protein Ade02nite_11630 [Actinoplanes deccanensis]